MHSDLNQQHFKILNDNVYIHPNVLKGKPGMLFIHAEWCGHCRRFMPIFHEIGSQIGNDFTCLVVESKEINDTLSHSLGVKYYPTIKFFDQAGRIIGTYPENEARTKDNVLNHICKVYHHCVLHK